MTNVDTAELRDCKAVAPNKLALRYPKRMRMTKVTLIEGVQSMVDVGEGEVWDHWQYTACWQCVSFRYSSMKGLLHTEQVSHSHRDTGPEGIPSARLINLELQVHHELIESAYEHRASRHQGCLPEPLVACSCKESRHMA